MSEIIVTTPDQLRAIVADAVRQATESLTPQSDVMTREEVAKLLRVNERTVMAYVAKSELPAHRVGGNHLRFFRSEVLRWLKEHGK